MSTSRAISAEDAKTEAPPSHEESPDTTVGKVLDRVMKSRLVRSARRYLLASGNLLAGGIAYSALFSIFAALAIAWTAFMAVLGSNEKLRQQTLDAINDALPGVIKDGSGSGLIAPESMVVETAFNLTSIIGLVVLLWSALSVMTALKKSLRRMVGIAWAPENFVIGKARDLLGFLAMALGVVVTAILGTIAGTAGKVVLEWLGLEGGFAAFSLRFAMLALSFVVDWLVYLMLLRFTAGIRAPRKDLFLGAAIGAIASGILRVLGTSAVGSVSDNPMLAGFAALITLLLWVNLAARIVLFVAAFTANPPAPFTPKVPEMMRFNETPNYVTASVPETLTWSHSTVTGVLEPDEALDPNAPKDEPIERVEWKGLAGRIQGWRVRRLEEKARKARASYEAGVARESRAAAAAKKK